MPEVFLNQQVDSKRVQIAHTFYSSSRWQCNEYTLLLIAKTAL